MTRPIGIAYGLLHQLLTLYVPSPKKNRDQCGHTLRRDRSLSRTAIMSFA